MLLKGKTAVITGCNRGIGKAMLEVFAKNGANLWACVRKSDDAFTHYLEGLAKETGVTIMPVYCDLTDAAQVKVAAQTIIAAKQPVDILINNAGMIYTSLFQMTSMEKMKELFEVNFFSQMLLTQYMVKIMTRQKSGNIINLSSSAAIEGNEGRTAYAASKAAMITATKVMGRELAAYNIRVNAIAPGLTQTDMMAGSTPEEALKYTLQRISLKRVGRPEEIANAALFLASDLSSYITGEVLRVDGGM
jgi:3-oxoacyl-[acyl-carrier protein] reductase